MRAQDAGLIEVETFCGYKDAGVGLLLMVGRNTLVSGNLVMVAGDTLVLAQPLSSELWPWGAGLD
jgi:hypothetical protein